MGASAHTSAAGTTTARSAGLGSWRSTLVAAAAVALAGLATALAMPRGPVTSAQLLGLLVSSLVIGAVAGRLMRSRWALMVALVGHVTAFELGRLGTPGPTVSSLELGSDYGVLAVVLGRLLYVLAGAVPLALGAALGAGVSARRVPAVLMAVALAGLAAAAVWPPSTPPILGPDGRPLAVSIASIEAVRLGGHEQWLLLRGHDTSRPVLLTLAGGPGQTDLAFARVLWRDLERDFVVVDWDQRGTGKSYPALDPAATLTLEQAIADTIELSGYLRARFDEERIYLHGESWGSTLAVLAAQRRPDLYHAVLSSGQMVSQHETDRRLYQDVLDLATRDGDEALARTVRAYGEPPYSSVFANALVMQQYERLYGPVAYPESSLARGPELAAVGPWGIFAGEYGLVEKVGVLRGLMDVFSVLYPQLQGIDFRRDVPRLDVPYYMLDGTAELTSRRDLALQWFEALDAPIKRRIVFENGAHSVGFEHFEAFRRLMAETVVPETYSVRR